MLLVETLTKLIQTIDSGELLDDIDMSLRCKVSVSLFQACLRIMLDQNEDGSWDGYQEQTCYAILALSHARHVSFFDDIQHKVQDCMDRGAAWLSSTMHQPEDLTWTSKTVYKVSFVAEVYKVSALKAARLKTSGAGRIGRSLPFTSVMEQMDGNMRLVRKTDLFSSLDEWQVRASMIESSFFIPLLQLQRVEIYSREEAGPDEEKYLNIIPFTWVGCNNRSRTFASTSWMYDMMVLSLLGYQTDEFMEAVAGPVFSHGKGLHRIIDNIFKDLRQNIPDSISNGEVDDSTINDKEGTHDSLVVKNVQSSLTKFVAYVMNHESVSRSSSWDRTYLLHEFRDFLHAHATQLEDNARFASQQAGDAFTSPAQTYFDWARTTGGSHVACAYSLAFSNCLVSANLGSGKEVYPTIVQKYLATAVARHLTTTCRMYNDFGSILRDINERNVNSMHFPEFLGCAGVEDKKQFLAQLGEYEHKCFNQALDQLDEECRGTLRVTSRYAVDSRKLSILRLFCDVTDLYDQLYVLKDLSSALKQKPNVRDTRSK